MHGDINQTLVPLLILLGSAAALSTVFYRAHVPALLAFLLVGLIFGPTGFALVTEVSELQAVAELGLVFLLFVLGLEFSLPKLLALRHTVLRLGGAQVLVCTAAFFLAFYWWGLSWQTAFIVAGGLALSSTAIVSRELIQLGQLQSRHGQISIGVLLFQDIVAVGLLIAVPLLAGKASMSSWQDVILPVGKSIALLLFFFFAARFLLPRILSEVARARSDELLVLSSLVMVLAAGVLTSYIGFSKELGAFLAGMMLGDSRFRHQLETDMRPFRDLLLGLFFISVGMLIDISMLREYWFRILYCGVLLLLFKSVIIAGVAKLMGEAWRAALPAGLALSQGGEFLFALLALASRDGLVTSDVASFLVSMTIVSMCFAPVLIRFALPITDGLLRHFYRAQHVEVSVETAPDHSHYRDHVIILGFGRVGQTLARFLKKLAIPYVVLETDPIRINEARAAEEPVFFGDSGKAAMLQSVGLDAARLVVISFDDELSSERIIRLIKQLRPDLPMLSRTRDDAYLDKLLQAGATEVVPETLEAGLTLVSHVLLLLKVPSRQIHAAIDEARRNRYKMLHGFYHGERLNWLDEKGEERIICHAVRLTDNAWANGRAINSLDWSGPQNPLDELHRGNQVMEEDSLRAEKFERGDIVLLKGTVSEIDRYETYLLSGKQ
jgi:CPA2 family monovalent cation:H+ antiporter-2